MAAKSAPQWAEKIATYAQSMQEANQFYSTPSILKTNADKGQCHLSVFNASGLAKAAI